jgi:hypothetical protein
MDDFHGLPVHAQNALRRAAPPPSTRLGPSVPKASRGFPASGPWRSPGFSRRPSRARHHALSSDELRRAKRWFDALQAAAPTQLGDGDRALAKKIGGWID